MEDFRGLVGRGITKCNQYKFSAISGETAEEKSLAKTLPPENLSTDKEIRQSGESKTSFGSPRSS
jgi:hypothetical protein